MLLPALGLGHVEECLDHTDDGSEESDHRSASGDGSEGRQTLLEPCDLNVSAVLDSRLDVVQRPSDSLDALLGDPGDRGIEFLAEGDSALDLSFVDIVTDIPHEVLVHLLGLVDHPPLLAEDVDCND